MRQGLVVGGRWLAGAALLLLAACGGEDDGTDGDAVSPDDADVSVPDVSPDVVEDRWDVLVDGDGEVADDVPPDGPDVPAEDVSPDVEPDGPEVEADVPADGPEVEADVSPDTVEDAGADGDADVPVLCSDVVPASDHLPPIVTGTTTTTVLVGFEASVPSPLTTYGLVTDPVTVVGGLGVTEGVQAFAADFDVGTPWPTIVFAAADYLSPPRDAWNWGAYEAFGVDVTNDSPRDVLFNIRLDYSRSGGLWDDRSAVLPAGQTRTFWFPLVPIEANDFWSRRVFYQPYDAAQVVMTRRGNPAGYVLDRTHVVAIVLYALDVQGTHWATTDPRRLVIDNLRVVDGDFYPLTTPLVDRYGQNAWFDWPQRVQCDDELAADGAAELAAARLAAPSDDEPRGWAAGPHLPPSLDGSWRVERNAGRWWFVTPGGELFWSLGATGLWFDRHTTIDGTTAGTVEPPAWTALRRELFEWLPDAETRMAPLVGAREHRTGTVLDWTETTANSYGVNLARKFAPGSDPLCATMPTSPTNCGFLARWVEVTLHRMGLWGFNTAGAWHSPEFTYGTWLEAQGIRHRTVNITILEGLWRLANAAHLDPDPAAQAWRMYDVYDPAFTALFPDDPAGAPSALVTDLEQLHCDDAFCPGLYVDNELFWGWWQPNLDQGRYRDVYALPLLVLAQTSATPGTASAAKQQFRALLEARYTDTTGLAAAWGLGSEPSGWPADWSAFLTTDVAQFVPAVTAGSRLEGDLSDYLSQFAHQYFRTVDRFLAAFAPGRLYLCPRFANSVPVPVLAAAADYCDVVGFNVYARSVDPADWAFGDVLERVLAGSRDRPVLIGEFHFGALDRGNLAAAIGSHLAVADQAARAAAFRRYADAALLGRRIIGVHWFEWVDEPVTGRLDDFEDFNCGIVRVTDRPHAELTAAVQVFAADMYGRRYSAPIP